MNEQINLMYKYPIICCNTWCRSPVYVCTSNEVCFERLHMYDCACVLVCTHKPDVFFELY